MTMTLISTVTVSVGGAASIDFTNIPQNYADLEIVVSGRANEANASTNLFLQVNSSTASYSYRYLYGNPPGGNGISSSATNASSIYGGVVSGNSATTNIFGSTRILIPNYSGNAYKTFSFDSLSENNSNTAFAFITAGLWSNTAAITNISILPSSGANFIQYSTASLYGITKGSGGATAA